MFRPALAVLLLAATPALAQESYDCVIEPFLVVEVGSPVEGLIVEIDAPRGAAVEKGQILARMESSVEEATLRMAEANARSTVELDIARSRVELLEKEVNRGRELAAKNITSASALDTVESELHQARLELRRAEQNIELTALDRDRAKTQLERRIIRSPIDGIILRRLIGPGEYVYSQAHVAQLARLDPLYVDVFLPTELYDQISVGQMATVRPARPIGGEYQAEVTAIDQVFDAASDTFGVRLQLPNPGNRLPAGVDCELVMPVG